MGLADAVLGFPREIIYTLLSNDRTQAGALFRRRAARKNCKSLGSGAKIGPRFVISGRDIQIGDGFSCYWDCRIVSEKSAVEIGKDVVLSHHVDICAGPGGSIKIGDRALIAQFCVFRNCAHKFSDLNAPILAQGHTEGFIEIEEDCHLASSVIVLPNTKLGKGCIVGSGSVISGTFAPYSIIVGNPGRIVGKRS